MCALAQLLYEPGPRYVAAMTDSKGMNGHRFERLLHGDPGDVPAMQRPRQADLKFDLEATLAAVVGLRAVVPDDAFTARTLGLEREGNGILIGDGGLIATVGYLITEAESVELTGRNGRRVPAEVLGFDNETGLGLVRALDDLDAAPLRLGSADTLSVGQPVVIAAGGGISRAMTALVASRRTFAGYWEYLLERAIYTAPPHPRWSGAAAIGISGDLLGVGSLLVQDAESEPRSVPGNLFIPIDLLLPILEPLAKTGRSGRPPRPWLGMLTAEVDERLVIASVTKGGPADGAGIREGDTILSLNGNAVSDLPDFYRRLWTAGPPGTAVRIDVVRHGARVAATVQTGNRYDYLKPPLRKTR